MFVSSGKTIATPNIGSGSVLRLSVEPYTWTVPSMGFGYTLRLKGVQVLELVEYGGDVSFEAEDGGFVGENLDSAMNDGESIPF